MRFTEGMIHEYKLCVKLSATINGQGSGNPVPGSRCKRYRRNKSALGRPLSV